MRQLLRLIAAIMRHSQRNAAFVYPGLWADPVREMCMILDGPRALAVLRQKKLNSLHPVKHISYK